MPEMDGLDFLKQVRNQQSRIPFILFTGQGSETVASEAILAGVTDYLQKGPGEDTYALLANRIRNAVESYRKEKELHKARMRFQLLVEESTDAIFILDRDATVTYASPVTERILGIQPEDLIGTSRSDLIHEDDLEKVERKFQKLKDHPKGRITVKFRFQNLRNSVNQVEARARNLLNHPMIEGIVVYVREYPPSPGETKPS